MISVTVLMSTYNGDKYLHNQIESILNQKGVSVNLLVRDDGSTDDTTKILNEYQDKGLLNWYSGTNLGSGRSFLDLLHHSNRDEYFAFSDQDDVWLDDKLTRAVGMISSHKPSGLPILYCSDFELVDQNLRLMSEHKHVTTTSYEAALASSCCTGCTVVFNTQLWSVLQGESPNILVMHDDWAHKVCLAVGGSVIFDNHRTLLYRQHGNNVEGGRRNGIQKISKLLRRLTSKKRIRSRQISEILRLYGSQMTPEFRELTQLISTYATLSMIQRINIILGHRIRTPYPRLNRGFFLAILLKYY